MAGGVLKNSEKQVNQTASYDRTITTGELAVGLQMLG